MAGYQDMANMGRYGDSMVAHVSPGEQIVPREVMAGNPDLARFIATAIRQAGMDPNRYRVGEEMSINPYTGQPEFFSFGKIFKKIFKAVKKVAPIAAIGLGGLGLAGVGPLAGALGSSGLLGGLSTASKVLGAVNSAQSLFGGQQKPQQQVLKQQRIAPAEAPEFKPQRPAEAARPGTLNELAGYAPEQTRSALATKGVNSGLGGEEQNYYKNLLQRSLIGEGNQVDTNNPNFLMPIESQYFSGQGYNTSDVMEFLKGIRG